MTNFENLSSSIESWSDQLFSDSRSWGMFYFRSQGLYGELMESCTLPQEDSLTSTGVAISPTHAGQCLMDLNRTVAFVRGLDEAISLKKSQGASPVRIFYVGCGPFATLILPLTYRFSPEDLQITLLDYHQESMDAAHNLLHGLEKGDFLDGEVVADAVNYELEPEARYDICITETLQRALTRECYVPIVQNLVKQLPPETLLIPEEIRVSGLWAEVPEGSDYRIAESTDEVKMDTVVQFNAETARSGQYVRSMTGKNPKLPTQKFCLQTEIDIFGPWKLGRNECGLTCPHPMEEVKFDAGDEVKFEYGLGEYLGLRQL